MGTNGGADGRNGLDHFDGVAFSKVEVFDQVATTADAEHIGAITTSANVEAFVAGQHVSVGTSIEVVVVNAAGQGVITGSSIEGFIAFAMQTGN